jgi:hypothetical protein
LTLILHTLLKGKYQRTTTSPPPPKEQKIPEISNAIQNELHNESQRKATKPTKIEVRHSDGGRRSRRRRAAAAVACGSILEIWDLADDTGPPIA